mmetsp:Transcript_31686/g.77286  ORF Transcript_31686/g.77286 Transcript_31686/m.77286 type:complete len:209 (-) Transcript_31686:21-647(-)
MACLRAPHGAPFEDWQSPSLASVAGQELSLPSRLLSSAVAAGVFGDLTRSLKACAACSCTTSSMALASPSPSRTAARASARAPWVGRSGSWSCSHAERRVRVHEQRQAAAAHAGTHDREGYTRTWSDATAWDGDSRASTTMGCSSRPSTADGGEGLPAFGAPSLGEEDARRGGDTPSVWRLPSAPLLDSSTAGALGSSSQPFAGFPST